MNGCRSRVGGLPTLRLDPEFVPLAIGLQWDEIPAHRGSSTDYNRSLPKVAIGRVWTAWLPDFVNFHPPLRIKN